MLSAGEGVNQGIHLRTVANRLLDVTQGAVNTVGGNHGISHGGTSISCQHAEGGRLASTIHSQQTKALEIGGWGYSPEL